MRFSCPSCGKRLKVADDAAGRPGKCPRCGQPVTPPGEPTEVIPVPPDLPPAVVAIPLPEENAFAIPDGSPRRRFVRPHRNAGLGTQNWHWLVGLAAVAVVGFVVLWIHAEVSAQRVERLRYEEERLEAILVRVVLLHGADSPNCKQVEAELIANRTEQHELINSPNLLVRWKLRK